MSKFIRHAFSLSVAGALLLTLSAQTTGQAKLVGKWKLDTAKSHFQNANVPPIKEATLIVSQATASAFKWTLTTTYMNGSRDVMGFDGAIDGKPYVCKSAQRGIQAPYIDNNGILEGTVAYPGGSTIHESTTVSPDGNMMTAQSTATFPSGSASWTEVWERVQEKKRK
jgi:hypothetical protein